MIRVLNFNTSAILSEYALSSFGIAFKGENFTKQLQLVHQCRLLSLCSYESKMFWINSCAFRRNLNLFSKKYIGISNSFSTSLFCSYATEEELSSSDESEIPCPVDPSSYESLAVNEEMRKKIQLICLEHTVARESGLRTPSSIPVRHMNELLHLNSYEDRIKYFSYMRKVEFKRIKGKTKKEFMKNVTNERIQERKIESALNNHIQYGLGKNSIFIRIQKDKMVSLYNHKLASAAMFGSKVVIDMDFDDYMNRKECKYCAKQLQELYAINRINKDPFDLYMCNVKSGGLSVQTFLRYMPNLYQSNCFFKVTEKSYLDLFPKEKIVYLTPHAPEPLKTFDHDAVYIIGGLIDTSGQPPLTFAKAKRENLKIAKLPLEEHLLWGSGARKSLCINHILEIMLELKNTNSWDKALRFVPRRKIRKLLPEDAGKIYLSETSRIMNKKHYFEN